MLAKFGGSLQLMLEQLVPGTNRCFKAVLPSMLALKVCSEYFSLCAEYESNTMEAIAKRLDIRHLRKKQKALCFLFVCLYALTFLKMNGLL